MNAKPITNASDVPDVKPKEHGLPTLKLSTIFAMTFGFFGVNMAFSLQSSQLGRIDQIYMTGAVKGRPFTEKNGRKSDRSSRLRSRFFYTTPAHPARIARQPY